ncbi:unnamed protein product [Leuciscus chuanchicus]
MRNAPPPRSKYMWQLSQPFMCKWPALLIIRFLKGARRLNPPRPPSVPAWDLSLVLRALKGPPFEQLQSADLRPLSLKTALLLALASVKRVGDLQALSTSASCLEFGPNDSKVFLKPRHGYVPKVLSTPFRAQVISLSALPVSGEDSDALTLCPVRALTIYLERSASFRQSEQLFVCFGGRTKGLPVTKLTLSRWIVDAISLAYTSLGLPCPIGEELNTALKSLQQKLQHNEKKKGEFEEAAQHINSQAEHTERQIKEEFEKLHQFLRDEEEATITALREEEEQKKQRMKEKLEEMITHISALSHTIRDMEEMMKDNDVSFLKNFKASMERVQISQPDPRMSSGALIHVSRYLGNLPFRVWKKMLETVQHTPLTLDPNTADPCLTLSADLTSVSYSDGDKTLPDNPERFDRYPCVLGSEGFNSGTHCWDVEVGDNTLWIIGITTASNQRKGLDFLKSNIWCVRYWNSKYISHSPEQGGTVFTVKQKLQRVRVQLDYDRGTVSFSDPVTKVCTTPPLRILPIKLFITAENHS